MSTSTFQLDPNIFNQTLYKKVIHVWFPGVDLSGQALDMNAVRRWFMGTPEEREAFDGICRTSFVHALESIGPDKVSEPSAQPFLDEMQRGRESSEEGAWTALSLTLLLDQMPRNIYRTDQGLRKVYTHYDRMAYALSRALLSTSPLARPDKHPVFARSGPHRLWFYMPLMHSEDLEAHHLLDEILAEYGKHVRALEGIEGSKMFLDAQLKAAKEHREILEKFGRYPHRNSALGRESTQAETEFLESGGATFGVARQKKGTAV